MPALRELFARYDVEFDDSKLRRGNKGLREADDNLEKVEKGADDASSSLRDLAQAVLGAFAIDAVAGFVGEIVTLNRELTVTARNAGLSNSQMTEMATRARLAGLELDNAADAMKDLQINAREAMTEPDSDRARFFRMLGLDAQTLAPIIDDQVVLFDSVIDRLGQLSDASQQVQVADELASDALVSWLGVARMSRPERQSLINDARRLSVQQARLLQITQDSTPALNELSGQWEELKAKFVSAILPALTEAAKVLTKILDLVNQMPEGAFSGILALAGVGVAAKGASAVVGGGRAIAGFLGGAGASAAAGAAGTAATAGAAGAGLAGTAGIAGRGLAAAGTVARFLGPIGLAVSGVVAALWVFDKGLKKVNFSTDTFVSELSSSLRGLFGLGRPRRQLNGQRTGTQGGGSDTPTGRQRGRVQRLGGTRLDHLLFGLDEESGEPGMLDRVRRGIDEASRVGSGALSGDEDSTRELFNQIINHSGTVSPPAPSSDPGGPTSQIFNINVDASNETDGVRIAQAVKNELGRSFDGMSRLYPAREV